MAMDIQQRQAQHGHRRDHTRYETETSRVILRADPVKNGEITLLGRPLPPPHLYRVKFDSHPDVELSEEGFEPEIWSDITKRVADRKTKLAKSLASVNSAHSTSGFQLDA